MSDALFEQLAAIEHERWADWQRYAHSQGIKLHDGGILLPPPVVERWERQIATPYADLSEREKESDREQVRRYWNLIRTEEATMTTTITVELTDEVAAAAGMERSVAELVPGRWAHLIAAGHDSWHAVDCPTSAGEPDGFGALGRAVVRAAGGDARNEREEQPA